MRFLSLLCEFFSSVAGVAGCASTLLHDLVMNPADGKFVSSLHVTLCLCLCEKDTAVTHYIVAFMSHWLCEKDTAVTHYIVASMSHCVCVCVRKTQL